jgi:hypothetical protein
VAGHVDIATVNCEVDIFKDSQPAFKFAIIYKGGLYWTCSVVMICKGNGTLGRKAH